MWFQQSKVIFPRTTQEALRICLKQGFNFHWQFHTDIRIFVIFLQQDQNIDNSQIIRAIQAQLRTELTNKGYNKMKQGIEKSDNIRIKVQVKSVVASKQAHFFVLVQLKQAFSNKSVKFRTETSSLTNRPQYERNLFTFSINKNSYTLKFGLMMAKSQLDSDATSAMVFGICSLPITSAGILEQNKGVFQNSLVFVDQGKDVGKFVAKIGLADTQYKVNEDGVIFDPLISRVLYNEECSDQARLESNIKILQQKLQKLYNQLLSTKKQEQFFEKLFYNLQEDEKQLRNQIDTLQKVNSKIEHRLDSLESLENLKIEIDMFSQSQEGKKVLIERLEYFQDRIYREIQQNQKLAIQYKRIRPEIQANLKKAEDHASKLKGRQLQQFEIENNSKILESYDNVLYQFQVNEQTIKSLAKMSEKSDLTARQAKLLLSQVNYQIKLTQMGVDQGKSAKQKQLLKNIQKQMEEFEKKEEKLSEEEEMVYKIKLVALQREIEEVRRKIHKFDDI